jgi:hypothetical protein
MKGWQVILLCLAVAALAVAGTLLFIRQVDEPRYTADQVIAVAKAYAGEECGGDSGDSIPFPPWGEEPDEASWTTVYLGDGKWEVTKECLSKTTWTFYEATGELKPS